MPRFTAPRRRDLSARNSIRSSRVLRAAVEAMEQRVMLSTYTVNTFVDQTDASSSTTVSLRDALAKAAANSGADTINVPAGSYKLTKGELAIADTSGAVTLQSTGGVATIDAQNKSGDVVDITNSASVVNLTGLYITGASFGASSSAAIFNRGILTVTNSSISGNASYALINADGSGFGGDRLVGVTVSNNGQGINNNASTITPLTIINSTITGTKNDGIVADANLSLFDSTVTGNLGFGVNAPYGNKVTIGNSIVAGNHTDGETTGDVTGLFTSKGGNIIGNLGATAGWVGSDQLGGGAAPALDPILAPLGNYGGLTQTEPPLGDSYALAKGVVSAIPSGITVDARGLSRVQSGAVDVGAVEVQRPAVISVIPIAAQQFGGAGTVKLGSFTAPGVSGPFVVGIHWGDGTPDTAVNVSAAGTIPGQFHKFGGTGTFEVSFAVTNGAGVLSNGAGDQVKIIPAPLQTIVVNTANDQTDPVASSTISLRDAVARADAALGPVAITFSPTVFATPKTITLKGNVGLNLYGNPFGATTITGSVAGVTVDATADGIQVSSGESAVLRDLTITATGSNAAYIFNEGGLTINNCTIKNIGQGIYNTGLLALTDSTVSGSSAEGAVSNSGAATINNCTITGNTNVGIENSGKAVISDCTITANFYDGITNTTGGTVTLSNSIVAKSILEYKGSGVGDINGPIKSLGHNIIGEKDSSSGWIASDLTGTIAHPLDPKLSPPGSYGGVTQTEFPLAGSPALNAGSTALVPAGVTTDQRGFGRIVGGKVDIGAFQSQSASTVTITPPAAQSAVAGIAKTISLGSFTDSGGTGPFTVTVGWADGTPASVFTKSTAGSLGTLSHTFNAVGALANTIVVVDHSGNLKLGTFTVNSTPQALKSYVVNTVSDVSDPISSATVSLRDAINRAGAYFGPVNITFSSTVFATNKTISLTSDVPKLQTNHFGLIDIIGPAAGVTIKSKTLLGDNGHGEPVPYDNELDVNLGVNAELSNVTLLQTGIVVDFGAVTLVNSTITGNSVVGNGGAIYNYHGSVTLLDSTISGNTAEVNAGPGGSFGGYGGAIENEGTLSIVNSTISGNTAGQRGGAIDNYGTATIIDSTISANTSGYGGAQGINNVAPSSTSSPKVTLANTIVADNGDGSGASDVAGAFVSSGHNLVGKKNGSTGLVATDLTGTIAAPLNAKLSILFNFGGPTQTMLPLSGSPALGAGSVSLIPSGVTTDQRGLTRVVNGKVDIGAVEIQKETPYGGSPAPFGLIQAENFDLGGPGAGYYNPQNINKGGVYRPTEGVGITAIPAADVGGYAVGFTDPGEYLNYTVSVAATGTYTLSFRVASQPKGGNFHLNIDGKNVTGTLSIPATGDYNKYVIVSKTGVSMTAGTHVLQLVIDSAGTGVGVAGNFDYIQAVKT